MTSVSSTASVSTSSGTNYITSTASGLNTEALIEAAVAQKTAPADTIDAKVTANDAKIAAYQELQTLASAVAGAMEALALSEYSALGSENAFDARSTSLSDEGGSGVSALAVDVDGDAITGDYEIEVLQLAQSMKVATQAGSSTLPVGVEGVMTLGVEGGASVDIAFTASMTINDLAKAINAQSGVTGVQASVINVDAENVQLVLSAVETNRDIVVSRASGDDVAAAIGLTDADGAFASVLREAQPSIVAIDGTRVDRDTNELTDVLDGVSISLAGLTSAPATLTIATDASTVKDAITDFVDAYNALKQYVQKQSAVGDEGAADDAILFADSLMRSLDSELKTLINSASPSAAGDVVLLSDLGIVWTSDNLLEVSDETALNDAILSNLSALESFFETRFTSSDANLKLLRNDTVQSLEFTLTVTTDETDAITGVLVNGQEGGFTISSGRLAGVAGTAYEGITFILSPATSGDISVSIQQGFANVIAQAMSLYDDSATSLIQQRIDALTEINSDLSERGNRIRENAEGYRDKLVAKYANMEAELEAAKLLQAQIKAILGASDDDD